jgi:hypothetical protein
MFVVQQFSEDQQARTNFVPGQDEGKLRDGRPILGRET